MRDYILLFVNGKQYNVTGADALLTLSDFLRLRLGLCGTKIVCSEGDCGSCTVLVGRPDGDKQLAYKSIDSCIQFVFQLDGSHIVSVEGLCGHDSSRGNSNPVWVGRSGDRPQRPGDRPQCPGVGQRPGLGGSNSNNGCPQLNSVQNAMIDCHGSQCGFCTPGFVVAMTGLLEAQKPLSIDGWRTGLTGNLCRCTGYSPIFEAGRQAQSAETRSLNEIYDASDILAAVHQTRSDSIAIDSDSADSLRTVFCPATLAEALELVGQYPDAKIVAGATDVGVQFNKGQIQPQLWIDLNRVSELEGVQIVGNAIIAGARASWAEIQHISRETVPQFEKIVAVFGSPQIRHVGTIGGNVINASPIADSLPLMLVCGAQLELASAQGTRTVDINDFYQGYKQFDLKPGEILTRIEIPLPPERGQLRLYKVSRRRDLDISSFTAAIYIETDGGDNGRLRNGSTISDAKIAYGAVAPTVLRLKKTEQFLCGKTLNEETMRQAGELAVAEITPISDVRGCQDYRLNLARNVLQKFLHESQQEFPVPS